MEGLLAPDDHGERQRFLIIPPLTAKTSWGCILAPLCNQRSRYTHDNKYPKGLLRRVVLTQEGAPLKISSLTGRI
jgi:hypothetical protein